MIKRLFYFLCTASLYYYLTSCASPLNPTGGPKDTIPPNLVTSIPLNQSLNFKDKTIALEYDERIKTDKLKDQLIITPLNESEYETTIKKNTFKITFDDPFKDSTTYTLNFRESIQDITEGNPTKDNKFTFSTGNYIDSLAIEGYVKDLLTYDTLESVVVGLYLAEDTVNIFNGSPYYFTEVDEEGNYLIENIKNGKYLLYAFIDANKNLKLETNKEKYGFSKDTLNLDSGTISRNLELVSLDLTEFKMMTAIASGQYFEINLNKYIVDYDIIPINNDHQFLTSKSKENKSIRFYNNFIDQDSLQISFTAIDSINSKLQDTVYVKFTESRRKPDDFIMSINPPGKTPIEQKFKAELVFNKPIISYNIDSIYFQYDTTKIVDISDTSFTWSKFNNKLTFETFIDKALIDTLEAQKKRMAEIKRDSVKANQENTEVKKQINSKEKKEQPSINKGLQLYFGLGAFISADMDTSNNYGFNYTFINPTDFGTQNITVQSDYSSFTIQLVNERFELVQEKQNEKEFTFKNIAPGKYKIRVLIDADNDGQWSPGNMKKQIEPEPVYIYPDILVIRADWETSLTLTF